MFIGTRLIFIIRAADEVVWWRILRSLCHYVCVCVDVCRCVRACDKIKTIGRNDLKLGTLVAEDTVETY